jgi:hypothetical protein
MFVFSFELEKNQLVPRLYYDSYAETRIIPGTVT